MNWEGGTDWKHCTLVRSKINQSEHLHMHLKFLWNMREIDTILKRFKISRNIFMPRDSCFRLQDIKVLRI